MKTLVSLSVIYKQRTSSNVSNVESILKLFEFVHNKVSSVKIGQLLLYERSYFFQLFKGDDTYVRQGGRCWLEYYY